MEHPDFWEKLEILSASAKYDASCASGFGRPGPPERLPIPGISPGWTGTGRCIPLLKVLFSNVCRFDCAYCVNRVSALIRRTAFAVDELADFTAALYRAGRIGGLFLSSGVFSDPDIVMERLIAVAKKLRTGGYAGYIHLKIIPGAGEKLIREGGRWADRLSVNIELPTDKSLRFLAPQKSGALIFGAMGEAAQAAAENREDRRHVKSAPAFSPAGQSTQLIVGASGEDDRTILTLSSALYRKFSLRRVYYAAYKPVSLGAGRGLPDLNAPPLVREHRLYQADWLLRFYHFSLREILEEGPFLDPWLDPKTAWALRRPGLFPLEVTRASYEELIRVPGIGAKTGRRIIEARAAAAFGGASRSLGFERLRRLGVILKRARYFILLNGACLDPLSRKKAEDPGALRRLLAEGEGAELQLPLFGF
jgi:putative DNA modification/repair radical SAM protein